MPESVADMGLTLVCKTCENEIDFTDDATAEIGICRQCGIAFLVEAPAAHSASRPA